MKLDILAFGSHPDDVELSCSGTILAHIAAGKKVGVIDLTLGELGTHGTPEIRRQEAEEAKKILGISVRENFGMRDGFFKNDEEHQLKVISAIRKYQPDIVLANAVSDRHPDHGRGAALVRDACFLSGLIRIETQENNQLRNAWRPKALYYYIQDRYIKPDVIVDISEFAEKKMEGIKTFRSQFYDPNSAEPPTYISSPNFLQTILARMSEHGKVIGVTYGEGFVADRTIGAKLLTELL